MPYSDSLSLLSFALSPLVPKKGEPSRKTTMAADSIISESAHTRFNLSGPPLPFNGASAVLSDTVDDEAS